MKFLVDTAMTADIKRLAGQDAVVGSTSNAKIAVSQGVTDYQRFVQELAPYADELDISISPPRADSNEQLLTDARRILSLGAFRIKIPVCTTSGASTAEAIVPLLDDGVKLNVTAVMSAEQIDQRLFNHLGLGHTIRVSLFAGRLRDAGMDPAVEVRRIRRLGVPGVAVVWASTRDLQAINDADAAGCDYVTASAALIDGYVADRPAPQDMSMSVLRSFEEAAITGRLFL